VFVLTCDLDSDADCSETGETCLRVASGSTDRNEDAEWVAKGHVIGGVDIVERRR
jgi:hypothetical protein